MAKVAQISTKKIQIDKANSTIVLAVSVAAFLVAFSLVSTKSLLSRRAYQERVATTREQARDTLKQNIDSVEDLKIKYNEFVGRQENIIEGSSDGKGERDGDNARLILDSLPSKYDFPAFASSLEKILKDRGYTIRSISGTDDEVAQSSGQVTGSNPVDMPFEMTVGSSYEGVLKLLQVLKLSIRPLHIQSFSITAGDGDDVDITIKGKSYYQPERTLNIVEEIVP